MTLRDQIREAAVLLTLAVVIAPPIFWVADWMRYGSEPNWFIFGLAVGGLLGGSVGGIIVAVIAGADDRRDAS